MNPKIQFFSDKTKFSSFLPKKESGKFSATCLDLSVMKAEFAQGVSEPNPVIGIDKEGITTILQDLQSLGHDDLLIISEFNPAIEKLQTGQLIVEIVNMVIMGYGN